jgi:peptidoglycan/LPS O-acetylase OafA/YrhL
MIQSDQRIGGLDVCRALAIILVVVSHALRFAPFTGEEAGTTELMLGFYGVELFFVLSGFLIGRILIRLNEAQFSLSMMRNFWVRRWMRTLPAYYAVLLITPLVYMLFFGAANLTVGQVLPYYFFAQNLWYPHPEFFGVAWSLSIEEWFYFIFPLVLLAFAQFRAGDHRNILHAAGFLFLAAFIFRILFAEAGAQWDATVRKVVLCRIDAIVPGLVMAWWMKRPSFALQNKTKLALTGLLLSALSVILFYTAGAAENAVNVVSAHLLFPLTGIAIALLLPALIAWTPQNPDARGLAFIRGISTISYALYLTHSLVWEVYLNYFPEQKEGAGQWFIFAGYLILSAVTAMLLHFGIERPLLRLRDSRFPEARAAVK